MATQFKIGAMATAIYTKGKKTFDDWHLALADEYVTYQDEYDGTINSTTLTVGKSIRYGYKLLAGEPCGAKKERTIVFLRIDSSSNGGAYKPAMTFRYRTLKEPIDFTFSVFKNKKKLFDEPSDEPDPNSDPITYPDPDPDCDLPTYDDTTGDDPDNGNTSGSDDPDDPPTGDGSDCDGTIGIAA